MGKDSFSALRSWLGCYWRYLVPIVAISGFSLYVGFARLLEILVSVDGVFVAIYLLGTALLPVFLGLQVSSLLRSRGIRVKLQSAIAAAVQSWSIGTLTPARTGDVSLAHFLKDHSPIVTNLAILVTDRLLTLLFLSVSGLISSLYLPQYLAGPLALSCGALLTVLLILILSISFTNHVSRIARWGSSITGNLPEQTLLETRSNLRNVKYLLILGSFIVIRWSLVFNLNLILFKAVFALPTLILIVAGTTTGRIVSLIPVSFWGIGLKEPFQILIYEPAGIIPAQVIAVSIVGLTCNFLIASIFPLLVGSKRRALPKESGVE